MSLLSRIFGMGNPLPPLRVMALRRVQPVRVQWERRPETPLPIIVRLQTIPRAQIRSTSAYWEKQGWIRGGNTYRGYFRTPFQALKGKVIAKGETFDVFFHDPKELLKRHPHHRCFHEREKNWYWVHWNTEPEDVNAAIMAVEGMLAEVFTHEHSC